MSASGSNNDRELGTGAPIGFIENEDSQVILMKTTVK